MHGSMQCVRGGGPKIHSPGVHKPSTCGGSTVGHPKVPTLGGLGSTLPTHGRNGHLCGTAWAGAASLGAASLGAAS